MRDRKPVQLLYILLAVWIVACAPVSHIHEMQRLDTSSGIQDKFTEDKLEYSRNIRCYAYDGKAVLKENGEKIQNRSEAIERLSAKAKYDDEKLSLGQKIILFPIVVVWFIVVGIDLTIAENAAGIPASPYVYHLNSKYERESFDNFKMGDLLVTENKFKEARERYAKAEAVAPMLSQKSDILFRIAETYNGEQNEKLATEYYSKFISYSIREYPDYFKKYDGKYENDMNQLDRKFTEAESHLKMNQNILLISAPLIIDSR